MTNLTIELNADYRQAFECVHKTALTFKSRNLRIDKQTMTVFFTADFKSGAVVILEYACFFTLHNISEKKCRLDISADGYIGAAACQGRTMQFVAEFIARFSAALSEAQQKDAEGNH